MLNANHKFCDLAAANNNMLNIANKSVFSGSFVKLNIAIVIGLVIIISILLKPGLS
jgi:hypothetical protein